MNALPLPALPAVFGFLFPEVADVIRRFDAAFDPDLLRVGTPASRLRAWIEEHVSADLAVPSTRDGRVDLDALSEPLTARAAELHAAVAPGLGDFGWRYPTSGSSEGIVHLLARLRTAGAHGIRVIDGEYEGFGITARQLGLDVASFPLAALPDCSPDPRAVWFISQPSARDGNLLPRAVLDDLLDRGHRVVLDLAYLGSTEPRAPLVDLRHPAIEAVVMSLSKPYGLFRWRIGWTFAREAVPSLFGKSMVQRHRAPAPGPGRPRDDRTDRSGAAVAQPAGGDRHIAERVTRPAAPARRRGPHRVAARDGRG